MVRIAITGPECSGKTTLAKWLASQIYDTLVLPEYAREFLRKKGVGYQYTCDDLLQIARKSALIINKGFKSNYDAMVADTEFYVIDIWCNEIFGNHQEEIVEMRKSFDFDLYLLCEPDIPWVQDGLRENPHDRYRLFEIYKTALLREGRTVEIVRGDGQPRLTEALDKVLRRFPNLMLKD